MFLVLLNDFFCVGVVLENFLVRAPREENVLLVVGGVELNAEWRSAIRKTSYYFTCFGVPKLDDAVITS